MIRHSRTMLVAGLAIGLLAAGPALAEGPLQKAGQALKSAGEKTGHAVEEGVEKTGAALKKAGQKIDEAAEKATDRIEGKDKGKAGETGKPAETAGTGAVAAGAAIGTDAALEAFIEDWSKALIAKDFDAWTGDWADDGVLIAPDEPTVTGRAAILAYIKTHFAAADSFTFSDWRFDTMGDVAVVTNQVVWGNDRFKQVIILREMEGVWLVEAVVLDPIQEPHS